MNFSSSSHSSKSRSRSNSNLKRKPSFSLPFTSVVGGSNCSSNSDSAPSPVFGAYSVPSSPNRIPSFKLDDSSNIKLPTIPKLSKNESLKIRTKRSYPNLSSKRSEPSLSHSRSPSTSIPISSPFHRELEIDPKSASPSNLSYSHDQLVKNVRVGSYNQQQSERVEVWDRQDPSPSRYVGQRDDAPLQPGLQSVGNQEQYAVIGKEKEKGHRRSSTSHHSSSKVREVSRTEPKLRKVSSNSNLSISSTSSAPIIQSKSSSPGNSKTSSPLRENEDGQKSNQLKNLKASGSSSTSLPILETNSNRHHSSERFKKIRSGRKDAPPELRIDSSTSDRGADERPMSSASSSSSFSNQSFSSTNDSTYSYPSSSNSHVQDPRFLKNPQMGKGKGKLGESCQTPTQNSWSKNGRKNSSSTTVDSIHSLSGSPGKYLTSSPSKQPSLIRYNVCPSISLKSSSNEKVNEYRNDDFGLEVRGKVGEKENQDDTSSTDQSKRNGSSSSSSSSSSANTSGSHLVMSMEGDVMFASKVKKGFFKSLSGKAGDVELRKGGVDGPIVMQANSNHSKSFTRISTPSFNISRHPSPALVGEYRGLMLDSRSRYANASKPIKSPRLDLVGDFGHPSSPNESDQKLDMSGWSGNLKQVDVWGQRWNFSLPKYEDVPLAKAILEIQEEKKSLLNSNSNHSSRSNSPANRSHSPNSYRSNSNNSNSSTSMPNLNHITAASISNRRKVSPIETHITSYALGQRDGERLFEWVGAGSAKWELIERDVEKLKGREKVVATFMREVTVKEGQGVLTFDQDFPDEEILILSLITLLDWHMKTKVY